MRRMSVKHTPDFDRVAGLPSRELTELDACAWADVLTPDLRKHPWSRGNVRPWQAISLAELVQCRGACAFLPVGIGKTFIFDMSPVVLDSPRPILVMSAALRDKTFADFAKHGRDWKRTRHPFQIITREILARDENEDLLFRLRPTFIGLEEADEFANLDSGAGARLDRYRTATWDDPNVVYAAFTGTPMRFSIMGMWHLLKWCLRDGAPVPLDRAEAELWANAIDGRVRNEAARVRPGPLGHGRAEAIAWIAKRIRETPGVLLVDGDSCDQPLTVRTRLPREDPILDAHFEKFSKFGVNPGGIEVTDDNEKNPLSKFRLDAQIGIGIASFWDPQPPLAWRFAYRAKSKFVRDTIKSTRRRGHDICDTEGQVFKRFPDAPPVRDWLHANADVKGTITTCVRWLSRSVIESVKDWLAEEASPGIVWCGSVEFAHELSRATGLAYYGAKGRTEGGAELHAAPEGRSMICSWGANKKGFNLQAWSRALIVMPPQSAKWLEQIIGRCHRAGQEHPVTIDILLGSGATIDAFETAISEAAHAKSIVTLTQKILRSKIIRAKPRITRSNRFRWASRKQDKDE